MIEIAFFTATTEVKASVCFKIKSPDLVSASHCKDQCVSVNGHYVPWTGQSLSLRRLITLFIETLFSCSNHCQNFFLRKVYFSDGVVLCVANIDEVLFLSEDVT